MKNAVTSVEKMFIKLAQEQLEMIEMQYHFVIFFIKQKLFL